MVSNQILQNTIDGLKSITRIDLCLIDTDGKVVATTFPDTEECEKAVLSFITSPAEEVRLFRDTSSLRLMMTSIRNLFCLHAVRQMMYI